MPFQITPLPFWHRSSNPAENANRQSTPRTPLVAIELSDTALTTAPTPSRDHFSIYFDRAFVAPELENDQRIETGSPCVSKPFNLA